MATTKPGNESEEEEYYEDDMVTINFSAASLLNEYLLGVDIRLYN
jgi:hypothetical protein